MSLCSFVASTEFDVAVPVIPVAGTKYPPRTCGRSKRTLRPEPIPRDKQSDGGTETVAAASYLTYIDNPLAARSFWWKIGCPHCYRIRQGVWCCEVIAHGVIEPFPLKGLPSFEDANAFFCGYFLLLLLLLFSAHILRKNHLLDLLYPRYLKNTNRQHGFHCPNLSPDLPVPIHPPAYCLSRQCPQ